MAKAPGTVDRPSAPSVPPVIGPLAAPSPVPGVRSPAAATGPPPPVVDLALRPVELAIQAVHLPLEAIGPSLGRQELAPGVADLEVQGIGPASLFLQPVAAAVVLTPLALQLAFERVEPIVEREASELGSADRTAERLEILVAGGQSCLERPPFPLARLPDLRDGVVDRNVEIQVLAQPGR